MLFIRENPHPLGSNPMYPRSIDIRFGDMRAIDTMIRTLEETKHKMEVG